MKEALASANVPDLTRIEQLSKTAYWLVGIVGWAALIVTCYVICRALASIAGSVKAISVRPW